MSKIIKCKYAGDPEDEFCKDCDGLHPVDDDGNVQEATQCGGYTPADEPVPETPASLSESCGDSHETDAPNKEYVKGITSIIRAESGLTREINGTYYKFMFSEERILPEGCDIESEKQALWDSVNSEVDAQLDAVRN